MTTPRSPEHDERVALTVREVAEALRVGQSTVRRLVDDGQIGALRFGRVIRIPTSEFERFVASARPGDAA